MNRQSLVAEFVRPVFQFLFPPLCLVCERLLDPDEKKLCRQCLTALRPASRTDLHFQQTRSRLLSEGIISEFIAAYYFEPGGPLQTAVHQLKYRGMTSLGILLGRYLGEVVQEQLAGERFSGIVPVPLHRSKERERGYNQSEFICRGMAQVLGLPVEAGLVKRSVYTQTQTKLGKSERKQNVAGAFVLAHGRRPLLKDPIFLLVDDVVTTGATMQSSARVLVEGGAKRVIGCAVAVAM
jgi:ComF family protein